VGEGKTVVPKREVCTKDVNVDPPSAFETNRGEKKKNMRMDFV